MTIVVKLVLARMQLGMMDASATMAGAANIPPFVHQMRAQDAMVVVRGFND